MVRAASTFGLTPVPPPLSYCLLKTKKENVSFHWKTYTLLHQLQVDWNCFHKGLPSQTVWEALSWQAMSWASDTVTPPHQDTGAVGPPTGTLGLGGPPPTEVKLMSCASGDLA